MGTTSVATTGVGQNLSNLVEPRGMPRGENQQSLGILSPDFTPGLEDQGLLTRHRARRNHDRATPRNSHSFLQEGREGADPRRLCIELQVSGQYNALRRSAQFPEPLGIRFRLSADYIDMSQYPA